MRKGGRAGGGRAKKGMKQRAIPEEDDEAVDNEDDMVATVSDGDSLEKTTAAEQTNVLMGARSSTLRGWAQKALNGGVFKLAAEASLELLSRDFNDYEAHQALL